MVLPLLLRMTPATATPPHTQAPMAPQITPSTPQPKTKAAAAPVCPRRLQTSPCSITRHLLSPCCPLLPFFAAVKCSSTPPLMIPPDQVATNACLRPAIKPDLLLLSPVSFPPPSPSPFKDCYHRRRALSHESLSDATKKKKNNGRDEIRERPRDETLLMLTWKG
jgi:hypothetical protein